MINTITSEHSFESILEGCYVISSSPNENFQNVTKYWNYLEVGFKYNSTTGQYTDEVIALAKFSIENVKPYEKILLQVYSQYKGICTDVYGINEDFNCDTVTYNTLPTKLTNNSVCINKVQGGDIFDISSLGDIKYGLIFKPSGSDSSTSFVLQKYTREYVYDDETLSINITGNSIDSDIIVSWNIDDTIEATITATQNGIVIATKSVTSNNVIFQAGTFTNNSDITFDVKVSKKGYLYSSTSKLTNIQYTQAKAVLIDIPGTSINVDENLTIAWVSENQTSFLLSVDGKTYTGTGTTEKSIVIPGGSISHGSKSITLTVNYIGQYYSNSDTISTTFIAYGKPNTPTFTCKTLVSSSMPYITWDVEEQVAYYLTINKILTTIETTGEVISPNKYYKLTNTLENNTTYVAELKIKNQYGLWSNVAKFEFSTQFDVPNAPTIQAFSSNGSIVLNVHTNIEDDTEYKNTEIWKREHFGKWKRMAYNLSSDDAWEDKYVGNGVEYEYKARNTGQTGGISESDVVTCIAEVKGYTLYNIEDMNKYFSFKYDVKVTPSIVTTMIANLFAGAEAPQVSTDGVMYWKTSIQFSTTDRYDITNIISLMKNKKPLLFKDCKGHKMFGHIVSGPSLQESDLGIITITFEFLETSFLEENVFRGDNTGLKLIKWDGTWKFDGIQTYHS
jgi:hypothetical protein